MDWLLFIFVCILTVVNIILLNDNIKVRNTLESFIVASNIYSSGYNAMAHKYNEVALAFNEMKEVTNNQSELLEAILSGKVPLVMPIHEPQEQAKVPRKSRKVRSDTPENLAGTE